jgi:hypothetical protein
VGRGNKSSSDDNDFLHGNLLKGVSVASTQRSRRARSMPVLRLNQLCRRPAHTTRCR